MPKYHANANPVPGSYPTSNFLPNCSEPPIMSGGQFLGRYEGSHNFHGFSLAHLIPTVSAQDVRSHTHAEAHYVLLIEGAYISSADDAPDICTRSALIYNPPGTTHRDRFHSETGRFFTITISAGMLRHSADAFIFPNAPLVLKGSALFLAQNIARQCQNLEHKSVLALESLCTELLGWTADAFKSIHADTPSWLMRARELLHDDCGSDLTLTDIAQAAGVHPVHLTRVFRSHFRCTPGEYLRRCRLDKAAALLVQGHASLAEIAAICGFFDQAHFSRAFKQAYGVPPRHHRIQASQSHMVNPMEGLLNTRR